VAGSEAGERRHVTYTLAVDLGGTHLRCATVSDDGEVSNRTERATPHDGTGTSALVDLMRAVANMTPCTSAVVGVPGRVDDRVGKLEHAPNLPPDWIEGLTEDTLSGQVGTPVALANDADLAAVGEAYAGAGRDHSDVAYLTISTGIGAGVVLGGVLVHGRRSMAEVGHTVIDLTRHRSGQPATLEELASGTALGREAAAAGLGPFAQDIIASATDGNADAARIWAGVVDAAAVGVVNLVWTFTPEVVVIGGGLGLIGDPLLGPLRDAVEREGPPALDPPCLIATAALGDNAGLAGAAWWARAFSTEHAGR
jgi:glucokinase